MLCFLWLKDSSQNPLRGRQWDLHHQVSEILTEITIGKDAQGKNAIWFIFAQHCLLSLLSLLRTSFPNKLMYYEGNIKTGKF